METKHDEEGNKQVSGDGENGEHKRIHSEETESVIIHLETHSRSSSSSSSSSSYLSPPKNLPESSNDDTEISPTDSPPVQVMDRDNNNNVDQGINYDPNRIPSSVFERSKSNIPAEWSCTSNESLFSIHLGRNSFSVYGNDLMKSGELYKPGELLAYSPALPMPPPPGGESKPVEEESSKVVVDSDKEEEVVVVVEEETHKEEKEEDKRESHEKEQQHPAVSWKTPTTSYRSNRSSNSAHSFSFPILAGAASEPANAETEEQKKQAKHSQESQQPAEAASNQKQSMCRWFACFPPCPWCCSSHSPCSCS